MLLCTVIHYPLSFSTKKLKAIFYQAKQWKKDNDGNYQCENCKQSFPYRTSISRHVQTCKPSNSPKVKENKCTFCDRIFPYPSDLNRYLNVHEKKGEMMVPSFIPSASASASSLFDDTSGLPSMNDTMLSDTMVGSSFISTLSNVQWHRDIILGFINWKSTSRRTCNIGFYRYSWRYSWSCTFTSMSTISWSRYWSTYQYVAPNTVIEGTRKWILIHTDAASFREADINQCLIQHLKSLLHSGKGQHQFNLLL